MDVLELTGILLALTVLLTYGNLRWLRMPHPIGAMVLALCLSAGLIVLDHLSVPVVHSIKATVAEIDFSHAVLRWMLAFMLFIGGLTIHLDEIVPERRSVLGLAVFGTLLFIMLVGAAMTGIIQWLGLPVTLLGCLTFAVLIAPTNPVAILDFFNSPRVPQRVKTALGGEAVFSVTVIAVLFFFLSDVAAGNRGLSAGDMALTFLVKDGGAILFGLAVGCLALWLIRQVDQAEYTVLTSLAAVVGGYALADRLGVCAAVAVACAGVCLGNAPRRLRMKREAMESLVRFWRPIDYGINTMLFVLLGLEMLVLQEDERLCYVLIAALVIWPLLLLARLVSVWTVGPNGKHRGQMQPAELAALTWGAPRGGISLALAMALPAGPQRDCWIAVTYVVVLLSIVVQGLTMNRLIPLLESSCDRCSNRLASPAE